MLDEPLEPPLPGFLPLRAHHPEGRRGPVGGRLRLEERPRRLVLAKLRLDARVEAERAILVGIESGTRLLAALERRPAARVHEAPLAPARGSA